MLRVSQKELSKTARRAEQADERVPLRLLGPSAADGSLVRALESYKVRERGIRVRRYAQFRGESVRRNIEKLAEFGQPLLRFRQS
ncbi:hypothetical protein GCM10027267_10600 [Paramicrobacterium agarici]